MVTVMIFGLTLRDVLGESEVEIEIAEPMTVRSLIESHQDRLGALIPFMGKSEILVTVNKKVGALDSPVKDGDTVKLTHQFNPDYEGARWHNP